MSNPTKHSAVVAIILSQGPSLPLECSVELVNLEQGNHKSFSMSLQIACHENVSCIEKTEYALR
jgi:hypothetical protein